MNVKITIRKILFVTIWLVIGAGMLTLLIAAISKKNKGLCSDYVISIKGAAINHFIDIKDVDLILKKAVNGKVKGQPIALLNLNELEKRLEYNSWIQDAELYFDSKDVLHVSVMEKEPAARIFTLNNTSFYIDSLGRKIPLSDKLSASVPVFTGFADNQSATVKDSLLLNDIRQTANFINSNPFWLSQVAQIDIAGDGTFEMTPVVGSHTVRLGNGQNISQKFNRLMVFYKEVLSKTGFEKYKLIDVQYKGQVVVSKYAGNPKVDSIQLRKNVEKLLRHAVDAENDTEIRAMQVIQKLEKDPAQNDVINIETTIPQNTNPAPSSPNPIESKPPVKTVTTTVAKPEVKKTDKPKTVQENKPKPEERKPKAVMPPKVVVEEENDDNNNL